VRKFIAAFLVLIAGASCVAQAFDLNIPDSVAIDKTSKNIQLPTTRIFVTKLKGYEINPVFFSILSKEGVGFNTFEDKESLDSYKKRVLDQDSSKLPEGFKKEYSMFYHYQKEFKLGEYKAFLNYTTSKDGDTIGQFGRPHWMWMQLSFGDKDFVAHIDVDFCRDSLTTKQEILSILLSAYVDKSARVDSNEFVPFTIDLSSSKFKFNRLNYNSDRDYYYTINGLGDAIDTIMENTIRIEKVVGYDPKKITFEMRKEILKQWYKYNNATNLLESKEIQIGGLRAYEMYYTSKMFHMGKKNLKSKPIKIYEVILGNEKTTLIFHGTALSDFDDMIKEFRNAAQTIKIK